MDASSRKDTNCQENYDSDKIKLLINQLHKSAEEYKSKLLISALTSYSQCLQMLNDIKEEKYQKYVYIIKYITALSFAESSVLKNLTEALTILKELEEKYSDKIPTLYATLGLVHYKLYNFDMAREAVKKGIEVLAKKKKIEPLYFPETDMAIEITVEENYKKSILELQSKCDSWHQPDAHCSFHDCQNIIAPQNKPRREIFFGDPAFNGMVIVTCSNANNPCTVKYHTACWKLLKDRISPMKISERNIIGMDCFTPNCEYLEPSVIAMIEIIGQDGKVKSSTKLNPKAYPSAVTASKGAIKKQIPTTTANSHPQENQQTKPSMSTNRIVQKAFRRLPHPNPTQDHTTQTAETSNSEKIEAIREKMQVLRLANFGTSGSSTWKFDEEYYGNPELYSVRKAINPVFNDSELGQKQSFIFSYFVTFVEKNAPTKIDDVIEHWETTLSGQIENHEAVLVYMDIINFLMQSIDFVILGKYIGTQRCIKLLYRTELEKMNKIQKDAIISETPNEEELLIDELFDTIKGNLSQKKSVTKQAEESEDSDSEHYHTPDNDKSLKNNTRQNRYKEVYISETESESNTEEADQKLSSLGWQTAKTAKKRPAPNSVKMNFDQLMRETDEYMNLLKMSQDYQKRLNEMSQELAEKNDALAALTQENQKLETLQQGKDQMISMFQREYIELENQNKIMRKTLTKKEEMMTEVLSAEKEVRRSFKKKLFHEQYVGSKKLIASYIAQCLMALDVIDHINKITESLMSRNLINSTEWASSLKQFENIMMELENLNIDTIDVDSIESYNGFSMIKNNVPQPPTVTLAQTVRTAFSHFIRHMCSTQVNQNFNATQNNIRPQQCNVVQQPLMQMPNVYSRQFGVPPPPIHQMIPAFVPYRPPPPIIPNFPPIPKGQQVMWSHPTEPEAIKLKLFDFKNKSESVETSDRSAVPSEDGSVSSKTESIGIIADKGTKSEANNAEAKSVKVPFSSLCSNATLSTSNGDARLEPKDAPAPVPGKVENSNLNKSANFGSTQSVLSLVGDKTKKPSRARERLLGFLEGKFPNVPNFDLVDSLDELRRNHNYSLSGLTMDKITSEVGPLIEKRQVKGIKLAYKIYEDDNKSAETKDSRAGAAQIIQKQRKTSASSSLSYSSERQELEFQQGKATGSKTWKPLEENVKPWEPKVETECVICVSELDRQKLSSIYTLDCKHTFHTECLRIWFRSNKSCPNCRAFSTLDDEYPPLPSFLQE